MPPVQFLLGCGQSRHSDSLSLGTIRRSPGPTNQQFVLFTPLFTLILTQVRSNNTPSLGSFLSESLPFTGPQCILGLP